MGYKKQKNKWTDICPVGIVQRTDNTQLRISAVYLNDDKQDIYISITEFSRYLKREDKLAGLILEDCIFKPSSNRVTIRLENANELNIVMTRVIHEAISFRVNEGTEYKD